MSQQQSYAVPAAGYPGQLVGSGHRKSSLINDLGAVRQVDDLTITAVVSTAYAFTVNGITVTYTSSANADIAEIRDGLIAAGRNLLLLEGVALFQPYGEKVRVQAAVPGTGITVAESDANLTLAHTTANTATESVPFGRAVVKNTASTTDQGVKLPSADDQIFMGIAVREHGMVDTTSASVGEIKPMSVFTALVGGGAIWVEVEQAVAVGDPVYYRYTVSGTQEYGVFRKDGDTDTADQVTGAMFVSSTTGAGLAVVRLP